MNIQEAIKNAEETYKASIRLQENETIEDAKRQRKLDLENLKEIIQTLNEEELQEVLIELEKNKYIKYGTVLQKLANARNK